MPLPIITSTYASAALNASPTSGHFLQHVSEGRDVRGGASIRLGMSGRFVRPHRVTSHTVLYVGHIVGTLDDSDQLGTLEDAIAAFEALVSLEGFGDLVELLPNGDTRTMAVRPRNYSVERNRRGVEYAEASVEFESMDDPEWAVT